MPPHAANHAALQRSAYSDDFARSHLPPAALWPELIFELPEIAYPPRLNCAAHFVDLHVAAGQGARTALYGADGRISYAELQARANRIAHVLRDDLGLSTGSRVLLRSGNNPALAAAWLGVVKAGCIAVTSMPLLRERELSTIVRKARIVAALCDHALAAEMELTLAACGELRHVLYFNAAHPEPAGLEARMAAQPADFANLDTAADDVALIAFTSGTTGVPKGTMHFHRDVLAICDVLSRQIIAPRADDVFIGTPPLAFTFGLGGLLLFPLRVGAVKQMLALKRAMPCNRVSGDHRSISTPAAPARNGNRNKPPKPKVKARGGVPMNTSSGTGAMIWRDNTSQIASTSR